MAQLVFEGLEIEDNRLILANVTNLPAPKDTFGEEEPVHGQWRGIHRETRIRTKDGKTTVKHVVVVKGVTIASMTQDVPELPEDDES